MCDERCQFRSWISKRHPILKLHLDVWCQFLNLDSLKDLKNVIDDLHFNTLVGVISPLSTPKTVFILELHLNVTNVLFWAVSTAGIWIYTFKLQICKGTVYSGFTRYPKIKTFPKPVWKCHLPSNCEFYHTKDHFWITSKCIFHPMFGLSIKQPKNKL